MIKMNLQLFGGRGGGSRMVSRSSAMSSGGSSFMSNQQNMEDYAVATDMFDRDFLETAEGKEALREFMRDEIEAGLTESEMREAIQSTGSNQRTPTPDLIINSDNLRDQVQNARQNGYKSSQVNEMVREATAAGWKETYPSYGADGTAYRKMQTNGTGALSERQAKVSVYKDHVYLYASDSNMASEYYFSNVSDAIQSGNRFVSNRRASTRRGGPKDSEFIVGSGRPRNR